MKCVLIVALAVLLASCRDARGASTGISANDIRTTTPVCSSSGTATEGTSVSLARADHKHGPLCSSTFAGLGTPANGTLLYCSDCTAANPCAGSGTGSVARRENGAWNCGSGSSGGAAGGDLGSTYPNPTVVASHLTVPLPVEQGGGGTTNGVGWKVPHTATFTCGGTTWSVVNLTAPTPIGAGAIAASVPANSGPGGAGARCFIKYTTNTSSGNAAGLLYNGGIDARTDFQPRSIFAIFTDTPTSTRRTWVGHPGGAVSSGNHIPPTPTASSAFASPYIMAGFDPSVNSGKWVIASGDGVNESSVDSGVAYSASTFYVIDIDMSLAPTSFRIGINGTYTTKTNNIPGNASNLGTEVATITETTSAAAIYVADYVVYR